MPIPSLVPQDLTAPGTHALVIGVSRYKHLADGEAPTQTATDFDLEQLSAAARSASEVAAWLLDDVGGYRKPAAPLRSLRVLLSPQPAEQLAPTIAARAADVREASIANVEEAMEEFTKAANTHRDNVAIVYVAGHGVQLTKTGAVLLVDDFGAKGAPTPKLRNALDVAGMHASMRGNACARTQFWFVDACRQKTAVARKFEQLGLPQTFDIPAGEVDSSPLFLASITGKPAYARPNGRTLFCEALLWALGGGAVASPEDGGLDAWHVSVATLLKALPARVSALAQAEGAEQFVDVAGRPLEAVFHEYKTPPDSDLRVELAPPEAKTKARATLKFDDQILVDALAEWPLERRVAAGLYRLDIVSDPPFLRREKILNIKPPSHATSINVTP
jgi:hypothetical protein